MTVVVRSAFRGWPTAPLGELCEVNIGKTPARERRGYWGPGSPWLSIADMNQGRDLATTKETITDLAVSECNCRAAAAGTVLLSFKLSIGKVGLARIPLYTNEAIAALPIRDRSRLIPDYLYWALKSIDLTLGLDRAAKGLTLNKDKLVGISIPVPPPTEQLRIAEVLDRAETLRTKRRAALAQLDTLIRAIFLDVFGDPATNPKGWPIRRIKDLLLSASYGTSEKSSTTGEFAVLRMNNITRTGEMDLSELKYMDLDPSHRDRYLLRTGDVLFNRTNSAELVGKSAIFRESQPMAYAGYLVRLRVNSENDPEYLAGFLNSGYAKTMLRGMCKSIIGMANINATEIQAMKIAQPPKKLQHAFARRIAALEKLKSVHHASLVELDALFAALQYRAFRGEL